MASHVIVFGGSHCSPVIALTQPSPHVDAVHAPPLQTPPVHVLQSIWFVPAEHFLPV
jgi:hypothetical protein